jgi:hypothetical protein
VAPFVPSYKTLFLAEMYSSTSLGRKPFGRRTFLDVMSTMTSSLPGMPATHLNHVSVWKAGGTIAMTRIKSSRQSFIIQATGVIVYLVDQTTVDPMTRSWPPKSKYLSAKWCPTKISGTVNFGLGLCFDQTQRESKHALPVHCIH